MRKEFLDMIKEWFNIYINFISVLIKKCYSK
jgi:hypothetical protein